MFFIMHRYSRCFFITTNLKTYHFGEFFEPEFHIAIRRAVNNSAEFNLGNRFQRKSRKISSFDIFGNPVEANCKVTGSAGAWQVECKLKDWNKVVIIEVQD